MAERYGFSSENKGAVDSALDFPRLSLKKGEVARIAVFGIGETEEGKKGIVLPEPEGAYTFGLESASGKYMGDFECLADEATKREDGYDPDVCPHCEAVQQGVSEDIVRKRRRRFVLPVFRYNTKGKSSEVLKPIGGQMICWRFTDRYFNTLVDEHMRWQGTGGLLRHDISLLCEVEEFQNFKISVEPEAVWLSSREITAAVIQAYQEAMKDIPQGLGAQLGRKLGKDDLAKRIAEATGDVEADVPDLSEDDAAAVGDLASDLFGTGGGDSAPAEEVEVPDTQAVEESAPSEAPELPSTEEGDLDFDSFFADSKS